MQKTNTTTPQLYNQTTSQVLTELSTNAKTGLSSIQAADLLEKNGPNALPEAKKTTILQKFVNQFKDLMIGILFAAAVIAAATGEVVDAIFILLVVILNAIFGVFQESRAESAIDALKAMATPNANVIRDGKEMSVPSPNLVVGDIIRLEAGDIIPADMRLLESNSLQIEESALTGESVPVDKTTDPIEGSDLSLGDRSNLAFMNSNVTYGRGLGVVTSVGIDTEVGRIADMLENADETVTPLQQNLKRLARLLTYLILGIAVIVFVMGMLRGTADVVDMLLTSISLAVAAIPEGLPAIVTITLALGTSRMAKNKALMRKLPAVETLGSTDVIGSDKTGTLTQNKMTVEKYTIGTDIVDSIQPIRNSESSIKLAQVMALNNDTKIGEEGLVGDPTETALISFNQNQGENLDDLFNQMPRVAEIPFDSERKLMTTVNQDGDGYLITVKGAPDELLKRAKQININGRIEALDETILKKLLAINSDFAKQALRVLAFAYKESATVPAKMTSDQVEQDLVFAGFVAMIDPERPEVAQAVQEAKEAGIVPVMITGDHAETAAAIAQRLGILEANQPNRILTGAQLDAISDADFENQVQNYSVYARVAPEHKVRIVKAWQKLGKVVAMTGDGVNDAPALKTADIGVAMGITGTEVSKGASDMVLADDNFATIVKAVEEGRKVFSNIQKALQFLLSSNIAEVLTIFFMTMFGWSILAPIMILWINLVTDTFPAIALGLEPNEPGIMKKPPRGRDSSFLGNGVGTAVIYQGILQAIIVLTVYWLALHFPDHPGNPELMHQDAITMTFMTLGLMQLVNAFNAKSVYQSVFKIRPFANKWFNLALLVSFLSMAVVVLIPGLNGLFHVSHLNGHQWLIVLIASLSIIVLVELVKLFQRKVLNRK